MYRFIHKKGFMALLIFILTFTISIMPLLATTDKETVPSDDLRVFDQTGLFTDDEFSKLEDAIATIQSTYSMDIAIVTTDNAEGKSSEAYADDFYDNNGIGYGSDADGLLLLIDMDNREIYISTCGSAIQYFTDERISTMLDNIYNYVADQKYYEGADRFLRDAKKYLEQGIPSHQYTVEGDFVYKPEPTTHKPFTNKYGDPLTPTNIGISAAASAVIAFVISLIARAIVISSYKNPKHTVPETAPNRSSIHYSERDDRFINSHTSRVRIQSNTSSGGSSHSGGRSSVHHSSSGRSHGGGGRKF